MPDDVVKDVARVLAHFTHQCLDASDKTGLEVLSNLQQNLNKIRNQCTVTSEELGHTQDRVTWQILLQPNWASCKSWIWLLQHRKRICEAFNIDTTGPLGANITNAMAAIRDEVRPLFRLLQVRGGDPFYRPRGKGKGKGKGRDQHQDTDSGEEDADPEHTVQHKWVMLRFPWQSPVPEEQAPWPC